MRVASVNWKLKHVRSDSGYFAHFYDLISEAHAEGAELVVVPELHVLELLSLAPDLEVKDSAKFLVQFAAEIESWIKRIADSSGMIIVGGSHFKQTTAGIRNVAAIGIPGQPLAFQEKNKLTVYERDIWNVEGGYGLVKLPSQLGVTICYDSEFPEASRVLAEDGMLIQCVPSWTETQRGFQRVRWSCLARAVENQNYVIHAALVGDLGREPVPENYGSSAIIAPSVEPFPVQAILRESPLNVEAVIVADLNLDLLRVARHEGEVTNWLDRSPNSWKLLD